MENKVRYSFTAKSKLTCESDVDGLKWLNEPKQYSFGAGEGDGAGLEVSMDKGTDFWQKTYYNPPLLNDNGHLLFKNMGSNMVMETSFDLRTTQQFDQAGLMIRKDTNHWIKTGLEVVDGKFRLSAVVTNDYSDWSTQDYPCGQLGLRLYRFGASFVIETFSQTTGKADFIRICHLNIKDDEPVCAGIFACAPLHADSKVVFDQLTFAECKEYPHKAL